MLEITTITTTTITTITITTTTTTLTPTLTTTTTTTSHLLMTSFYPSFKCMFLVSTTGITTT